MVVPVLDLRESDETKLSEELVAGLETTGFAYLINHGVPQECIDKVFELSRNFFALPEDVKATGRRPTSGSNFGWVGRGVEALNPERPGDNKECFNFTPRDEANWVKHPSTEEFRAGLEELYRASTVLSLRVLKLIGIGLKTTDTSLFAKGHELMPLDRAAEGSSTTIRTLYYPPSTSNQEGQVACGEHSDYGSITLLYQGGQAGLQVKPRGSDEYVDAPPIPGSVVVNLGDLLQQWTDDRLSASKHRVIVKNPSVERQSIAFFCHPDDEFMIESPTGKYPPVSSRDWLQQRFAATYKGK